ncbi:MAG: PqqD family protein [Acidimicrobiia bacterium]|nr:PqqD family protein [Acidimicrobiia bacterium]
MPAPQGPTYQPTDGVVARVVSDETVVVDLDSERYFSLNTTGAVVWSAVIAGRSVEQAAMELAEIYDVADQTARVDAEEIVRQLVEAGLLLPRP